MTWMKARQPSRCWFRLPAPEPPALAGLNHMTHLTWYIPWATHSPFHHPARKLFLPAEAAVWPLCYTWAVRSGNWEQNQYLPWVSETGKECWNTTNSKNWARFILPQRKVQWATGD